MSNWPLVLIALLAAALIGLAVWAVNDLNAFGQRCVESGGTVQVDDDSGMVWCVPSNGNN